jgi:hypothetical protein
MTDSAATPPIATERDGRDWLTVAAMVAVAAAAATLSFTSLMDLARVCGYGPRLAWLLPISIDAYALTATRVWLRGGVGERTRRYARGNAVAAIGLSVAGNATFHCLAAAGVLSLVGWAQLLVVAVSAVPPVVLGLVGHLHALLAAESPASPTAPSAATDSAGITSSTATPVEPAIPPAPPAELDVAAGPDPLAAGSGDPRPARREATTSRPAAGGSKAARLAALVEAEVAPGDDRSVSELARVFAPRVGAHEGHARKVIRQVLLARDTAADEPAQMTHENTNSDGNVVRLAPFAVAGGRGGQS